MAVVVLWRCDDAYPIFKTSQISRGDVRAHIAFSHKKVEYESESIRDFAHFTAGSFGRKQRGPGLRCMKSSSALVVRIFIPTPPTPAFLANIQYRINMSFNGRKYCKLFVCLKLPLCLRLRADVVKHPGIQFHT